MPRTSPAINASGITPAQQTRPHCSTQSLSKGLKSGRTKNGEAQVTEGQPVGPVSQEGKPGRASLKSIQHETDPVLEPGEILIVRGVDDAEPRGEQPHFGQQGKSGEAAQHETNDENPERKPIA